MDLQIHFASSGLAAVLAATKSDTTGYFGDKDKLNPINHLLETAYGRGVPVTVAATAI
jgi:hypothetical protein